jgi:hypothetical protein
MIKTMPPESKEYYESRKALMSKSREAIETELSAQKTQLAKGIVDHISYINIEKHLKYIKMLQDAWDIINAEGRDAFQELKYF